MNDLSRLKGGDASDVTSEGDIRNYRQSRASV